MTPRSWRTTDGRLVRVAQETAAAGIWVTPTLVAWDYNRRQASDEFHALMARPEMRFLTPAERDRWANRNPYRVPDMIEPMTRAARQRYAELLSLLVGRLHEAGVPLLAGSDVGMVGILPGSSLHEELELLVQAGLSPYEALRTATVNPAIYLDAADEVGRVAEGLLADLVLLEGNPLDDIRHSRSRVGVMKRGRWFPADELDDALQRLADDRR
jgi:imidazolonepropionase-like amidohydrolase